MTDKSAFAWVIEAPGPRYLATRNVGGWGFHWTADHNDALRFYSIQHADAVMEAVRNLDRQINGFDKGLFAFEATLGNAKPVEHGWLDAA